MNTSCQIQVIEEDRNENRAGWRESAVAWPEQNEMLKFQHWE